MTAIQRFFSLVLCVGLVMIFFPDFGAAGWSFAGVLILLGAGVILIMSVVDSLFSLYRFEGINRFLSWIFIACVLLAMLWFFPQEDKVSPINKLKYGQIPTGADIRRGIQKFSFNFEFDKRNARSEKNFVNQQDKQQPATKTQPKARRQTAQKKQSIDIVVED